MAYICDCCIQEAEVGGLLPVEDSLGYTVNYRLVLNSKNLHREREGGGEEEQGGKRKNNVGKEEVRTVTEMSLPVDFICAPLGNIRE